jgi:hypothetical protein
MSAQLLGVVLSFASPDGQQLALTASLTGAATASLDWGQLHYEKSEASEVLSFPSLPVPTSTPTHYRLHIAGQPVIEEWVKPPAPAEGPLRIATYGDNRDGPGPHATLLAQMVVADPHVIVHTGDVVRYNEDEAGWESYFTTTLPLARRVPVILALGNHELSNKRVGSAAARTRVMRHMPAVADTLASDLRAPWGAFHVRVGPALFISLDSNNALRAGSPQYQFVERVLAARGDARFVFVAMHHGFVSAGRHGPHPDGADMYALLQAEGITAVLAGHDHTYQRILQGRLTTVVSGGGGAPLYARTHVIPGVQAFSSVYNWTQLDLVGDRVQLAAYALNGTLLDRAAFPPESAIAPTDPTRSLWLLLGGQVLVLVALLATVVRWTRRGSA